MCSFIAAFLFSLRQQAGQLGRAVAYISFILHFAYNEV